MQVNRDSLSVNSNIQPLGDNVMCQIKHILPVAIMLCMKALKTRLSYRQNGNSMIDSFPSSFSVVVSLRVNPRIHSVWHTTAEHFVTVKRCTTSSRSAHLNLRLALSDWAPTDFPSFFTSTPETQRLVLICHCKSHYVIILWENGFEAAWSD